MPCLELSKLPSYYDTLQEANNKYADQTARRSLISMEIDNSDNILSNQSTCSYKSSTNWYVRPSAQSDQSSMCALLVAKG